MSIYKPPKADTDLLRCLNDIEQQLNELSRATPSVPATDRELLERIEVLESRLNGLSQFERVEQPRADYKNDGNPSRVLHEDGTWVEPLAGIAKAVPSGLDTAGTRPSSLINVLGSLAITGALSADTIHGRKSRIHVRGARVSRSTNFSVTANTPDNVPFDTVDWDTDNFYSAPGLLPDELIIPAGMDGYYIASAAGRFTSLTAGDYHQLRIEKNSSGTPTANNIIGIVTGADPTNGAWDGIVVTPPVHLKAGDEVELIVDSNHNDTFAAITTWTTKTPYLALLYLGK